MGKVTGFIEWQRIVPSRRPVDERIHDWREVDAEANQGRDRQLIVARPMPLDAPGRARLDGLDDRLREPPAECRRRT